MRYYLPPDSDGTIHFFTKINGEYRIVQVFPDGQDSPGWGRTSALFELIDYYRGYFERRNIPDELEKAKRFFDSPLYKELEKYDI